MGVSIKAALLQTGIMQHKVVYNELLPSEKPLRVVLLNFYVHICYLPNSPIVNSKLSMKIVCHSNM